MSYAIRADRDDPGRPHEEIALLWVPRIPLLPRFDGVVRMRIAGLRTLIRIEGSYAPPLGLAGAAFDSLCGAALARATIDDLLARICCELERREREWREAYEVAHDRAPVAA